LFQSLPKKQIEEFGETPKLQPPQICWKIKGRRNREGKKKRRRTQGKTKDYISLILITYSDYKIV
jgi:hypothetical protein